MLQSLLLRRLRSGGAARCRSVLVLGLGATITLPDTLRAQETQEQSTDESDVLDVVIVTGSRIATSNIESPIPTQVLGIAEIEAGGTTDLGELVEQLPGVYLGISPTNSLLSTQNAGLSVVSLRSLGTNRTLTLINGRRVVSNSGSAQRVDTGTIPTGFLDRIDITTGGASAVYRSDAIAGVANIVLKDSFDGFTFDTRLGVSNEGGRDELSLDATWGMDFAGGRGNIMLGGMYERQEEVFAYQREYALSDLEIDIATGEFEVNRSSSLPGGRFEVGDAWNIDGVWQNDQAGSQYCLDDGRVPACDDYQAAIDGYNFRPLSMLFPERDRWAALAKAQYELTDDLRGWAMVQYSEIETRAERAAAIALDSNQYGPFDDRVRIGELPNDHPFVHPAVRETLTGTVDWRRRFDEVGNRFRASTRETLRTSFGLDGAINDNWVWNAYLGYGKHEQSQIRENELNRLKISLALDIEPDPDNAGGFRCVDAAARADGCVPLDLFGAGSVTPEMANYIRATDRLAQELEQTTASLSASGQVFELPAGGVQMALGVDYRKEEQQTSGDPDTNAGLTTTGFIPDIVGEFDVTEAFVEFNVPLIADAPGIQSLDLATAYRVADYSTIGDVASWNFGLSYAPSDDIRFRAQISQAQRAPDITELFSSQRSDFDGVNDPCDNVTATTAGTVADNCRSITAIVDAIAADGSFQQDSTSVFGPNVGNPELQEETADTITYGFVFTPRFLDGFTFIADYYKIELEDAIASVDSQLAADLCYRDEGFPNNRFCESITRDSEGQIDRIVNQSENLNELVSEGIDVTLSYDFSVPKLPGEFSASTIYSRILTNEERFNGPDGEVVDDFAGEIGLPEHEYRFTLRWEPTDNFTLRYRANYQGTAVDDNAFDPADLGADLKVEINLTHDLYASYTVDGDHRYRIYAGVNNIEDQHGPYLPDGYVNGSNFNVSSAYDRVGRRYYAGMNFRW